MTTETVTTYVAIDGTKFYTEDDCIMYESKIKSCGFYCYKMGTLAGRPEDAEPCLEHTDDPTEAILVVINSQEAGKTFNRLCDAYGIYSPFDEERYRARKSIAEKTHTACTLTEATPRRGVFFYDYTEDGWVSWADIEKDYLEKKSLMEEATDRIHPGWRKESNV